MMVMVIVVVAADSTQLTERLAHRMVVLQLPPIIRGGIQRGRPDRSH
jgi:hypothetical protein